jgi:hypothetical protein
MKNYKHRLLSVTKKKSPFEISDEINKAVTIRLKNIKAGDIVRYGYNSDTLKVISATPKLISCCDNDGNKIFFHGIESTSPGIRVDDDIVTDNRLIIID